MVSRIMYNIITMYSIIPPPCKGSQNNRQSFIGWLLLYQFIGVFVNGFMHFNPRPSRRGVGRIELPIAQMQILF